MAKRDINDDGQTDRKRLFEKLYVARVSAAETVRTVRRDVHAIFRDAYNEARAALEVFLDQTKTER